MPWGTINSSLQVHAEPALAQELLFTLYGGIERFFTHVSNKKVGKNNEKR